jgi:hypothetical protein
LRNESESIADIINNVKIIYVNNATILDDKDVSAKSAREDSRKRILEHLKLYRNEGKCKPRSGDLYERIKKFNEADLTRKKKHLNDTGEWVEKIRIFIEWRKNMKEEIYNYMTNLLFHVKNCEVSVGYGRYISSAGDKYKIGKSNNEIIKEGADYIKKLMVDEGDNNKKKWEDLTIEDFMKELDKFYEYYHNKYDIYAKELTVSKYLKFKYLPSDFVMCVTGNAIEFGSRFVEIIIEYIHHHKISNMIKEDKEKRFLLGKKLRDQIIKEDHEVLNRSSIKIIEEFRFKNLYDIETVFEKLFALVEKRRTNDENSGSNETSEINVTYQQEPNKTKEFPYTAINREKELLFEMFQEVDKLLNYGENSGSNETSEINVTNQQESNKAKEFAYTVINRKKELLFEKFREDDKLLKMEQKELQEDYKNTKNEVKELKEKLEKEYLTFLSKARIEVPSKL